MTAPLQPVFAPALPQVIKGRHYTTSHRGLELSGAIYEDCHFDHLTWSDCRLADLRFVNCRFDQNRFESCHFGNLIFEGCTINAARWFDCVLAGLCLIGGEIRDSAWANCLVKDTNFAKTIGSNWRFDMARTTHVSVIESELTNVALNGGQWSNASWISARMSEASVRGVELANFIVGMSDCSRWSVTECSGSNVRWLNSRVDGMTIRSCELRQAAWSNSAWEHGEISASQLPIASFDRARVSHLAVRNVELMQAIFDHATVVDSDLRGLRAPRIGLRHAQLVRVQLSGAELSGLDARGAVLEDVGLNGADCRSGLLIGQPRRAWLASDTRGSLFDEAADEDDRLWRQRTQPGARGV
ncbi:pentapeptide repeat-containing protein [Burkholderia seminalis]|uniref:pentapeptide repeat-containing protein n=1 Tax=Burkholderia seminalis TaxID=488731 RepID=UPI001454B650|nr:pentapeptide repeat-containing protein [Burkholderia seminalis]MCA8435396.1 pentapeptide repeat-containing protein [Burkholderia seminalis]VWC33143.1 pentapeptide repeat-containing protein [Burkholderia seminalis]